MTHLKNKISVALGRLRPFCRAQSVRLEGFLYMDCPPKTDNVLPSPDDPRFVPFSGDWHAAPDAHGWFFLRVEVPEAMRGRPLVFSLRDGARGSNAGNPQFLLYVNGEMAQGMDVHHTTARLGVGDAFDLHLYAYSGSSPAPAERMNAALYTVDEDVTRLYHDLRVPFEALDVLDARSRAWADTLDALNEAVDCLDFLEAPGGRFRKSVAEAEESLKKSLYGRLAGPRPENVVLVGHTHIDVAYRWTLAQTREKVQRSFSTALANLGAYPAFRFFQSSPQLYQFTREEAPALYERIRAAIRDGRWEADGAMWLESDTNLPSGESLVRQFLYGKRFFSEELGVDSHVLWLPDVFGYSGALPQIMRRAGVEYFVTCKLGWNDTDTFPYDVFHWRGIDGSEVNAYLITSQQYAHGEPYRGTDYNASVTPSFLLGACDRLQQKELTSEVLFPFGYGDGGGGPTEEQIESAARLSAGLPGLPGARIGSVGEFLTDTFAQIEPKKLPRWEGELYFEYHRGTLTSMAKNKKNNRRAEFLYQNAEGLAVADALLRGAPYPRETLRRGWEGILLCQFHDILPGSAIREVYEQSDRDYAWILADGAAVADGARSHIAAGIGTAGGLLVFNPHAAATAGYVRDGGRTVYVENVPPKGYAVLTPKEPDGSVAVTKNSLENRYLRLTLDARGVITSIYDKENDREVLRPGGAGNRLVVYEDRPIKYDAWEIAPYYADKSWELDALSACEIVRDGARAGVRLTRPFLSSTVTQTIWLYEDTRQIDFETEADWNEHHYLLRTLFETSVHAARATYNIQFGDIERPTVTNTSWDRARFEVCAHRFADLSEGGYGVTLMNDCKYGHSVRNGVMGLSLLKCATEPNPVADIGRHRFTYSLYPHAGPLAASEAVPLSYLLNEPMTAVRLGAQSGPLPERFSLASVDAPNVILETIKEAEDGDGVVMRLYESGNCRTRCTLTLGFAAASACLCDLLERDETPLALADGRIPLTLTPYEIVTVRVRRA